MLPSSAGKIEIHDRDIAKYNDPTQFSTCPQFNTHLLNELTPYEHVRFYSMLFQLDPEVAETETNRLIGLLGLEEHIMQFNTFITQK
jgi:ABC-type multidrug transport system ATPase subunit